MAKLAHQILAYQLPGVSACVLPMAYCLVVVIQEAHIYGTLSCVSSWQTAAMPTIHFIDGKAHHPCSFGQGAAFHRYVAQGIQSCHCDTRDAFLWYLPMCVSLEDFVDVAMFVILFIDWEAHLHCSSGKWSAFCVHNTQDKASCSCDWETHTYGVLSCVYFWKTWWKPQFLPSCDRLTISVHLVNNWPSHVYCARYTVLLLCLKGLMLEYLVLCIFLTDVVGTTMHSVFYNTFYGWGGSHSLLTWSRLIFHVYVTQDRQGFTPVVSCHLHLSSRLCAFHNA